MKSIGSKGLSPARVHLQMITGYNKRKRLNPSWMCSVKSCFVCGKHYLAGPRHSGDKITASIEKMKYEHLTAILTVEDL